MVTIDDILSADENEPFGLADEIIISNSGYVFDDNTPARLKRFMPAISASFCKDPNSIDFSDPIIQNTLHTTKDFVSLYNILDRISAQKAQECNIPFYDLYKSNFRLFDSGRVFITKALMETYKKDGIESMWGDELIKSFKFVTLLFDRAKEQDKIDIIDTIIENDYPINLVPHELLGDEQFLIRYMNHHNMDRELKMAVYASLKGTEYKGKFEEVFCNATGYSSLEEYIQNEIVLEEKNDPVSKLVQIAAIRLNTMKLLNQKGIDGIEVIVNEYCVDQRLQHSGGCGDDKLHIYTFPNTTSKERYKTSLHEARHAHQDKAVATGNIKEYPDVDIFSKEKVLRECLNYGYYLYNYFSLAIEYDADYFAEKTVREMDGLPSDDKTIDENIRYTRCYQRKELDGEEMHIDDLFELVLNRELDSNKAEDIKEVLLDEYPVLYYQYNVSDEGIRKKTPSELLQGLIEDGQEDIYIGLIKSSITPLKDKYSEKNIEEYTRLLNRDDIDEEVKEKLLPIVEEYRSKHITRNV